ncbi:MAG: hypothetical protein ACREOZ_02135 [Gloeomargaritales cyanobacterium]
MRRAGYSDREILKIIPAYENYTNPLQTLRNDIKKALDDSITMQSRELVALQYARYERLLRVVFSAACNGDLDAHKQALSTIKQQSELMQLNKTTNDDGGEVDRWLNEMLGEDELEDDLESDYDD